MLFLITKCKGIALITVYFVIVILTILGTVFFMQAHTESLLARRHKISTKAICIAEAGIEEALYDLKQDFDNDEDWSDAITISGTTYGPNTSAFYKIYDSKALPGSGGSYTVELKNVSGEKRKIWIRSTGTIDGIERKIETYVQMTSIPVWDWGNAILAGTGAAGSMINGNVKIRGSVHILGAGLDSDDLAIDMGGGANIGNNYSDMPIDLKSKVPALGTVVFGGETVETLYAELRVKRGVVDINSGSASVGDPNLTGNTVKETMDGVYVTDGFTGSHAGNVYSDNGTGNAYDLGSITFPSLTDSDGVVLVNYFENTALVISDSADLDILSNFRPDTSFNRSDGTNSITFDGAGNLTITGKVYIKGVPDEEHPNRGDLIINSHGNADTITYTGSGTILVKGNVEINANLVTAVPAAGNTTFPYITVGGAEVDNIIGIMTPENITFDSSRIDVMGLFYAEKRITSSKQTDVAGAFISNYFDMGDQVPAIYEIPEVINHLPSGMDGGDTIEIVAWQEI